MTTTMPTLDFDKIVTHIRDAGITAYVEQTGGGCATIYAGTPITDPTTGDRRYPAIAGPGGFDGPAWTKPSGHTDEFYVGPDDDGEHPPTWSASDIDDEFTCAAEIIREARRNTPGGGQADDIHVGSVGDDHPIRVTLVKAPVGYIVHVDHGDDPGDEDVPVWVNVDDRQVHPEPKRTVQ